MVLGLNDNHRIYNRGNGNNGSDGFQKGLFLEIVIMVIILSLIGMETLELELRISYKLDVIGTASISSTLDVSGVTTLHGKTSMIDDVDISSNVAIAMSARNITDDKHLHFSDTLYTKLSEYTDFKPNYSVYLSSNGTTTTASTDTITNTDIFTYVFNLNQ